MFCANYSLMRRKNRALVYSIIGVVLLSAVAGLTGFNKSVQQDTANVKLMIGFPPLIIWSPVYTAIEKGYYAEEGLDITLSYSQEGSVGPIKQLAAGKVDFGYAGGDAVIMSGSKANVVMVYQIEQRQPFVIMSKDKAGIKEPKDLLGKKVATPSFGSSAYLVDRVILNKAGVDYNKVEFVATGASGRLPAFFSGKVDAADAHVIFLPIVKSKNISANVIYASDYTGLPAIGIVTSKRMIKEHPDIVRKFVKATKKGLEYAVAHPEEAADIFVKFQPEAAKSKGLQIAMWKTYAKEILLTKDGKIPSGKMSYEVWSKAQDDLYKAGVVDKKLDVSRFYTNKFI